MTRILVSILSTSLSMAVETILLLGVALILVLVLGLERAGVSDEGAIVVLVAVVGGIASEVLGRRFIPSLWRRVQSGLRTIEQRLADFSNTSGGKGILLPELANEDLVTLVADGRRAAERKRLVQLAIRRLQKDAKGSPVGGLAVLQPKTPSWGFPYLLAYELARELNVRVDFFEKIYMQMEFRSSIGTLGGSKYVGILRLDEGERALEQQVKDRLAETTGAKIGSTFTIAKSA